MKSFNLTCEMWQNKTKKIYASCLILELQRSISIYWGLEIREMIQFFSIFSLLDEITSVVKYTELR